MSELWYPVYEVLRNTIFQYATVCALSSWLGKVWAQRILEKEIAKCKEEIECVKKRLERKNYVSQVRFDAEFAIYRDLCSSMIMAVNDVGLLFPEGDLPYLPPEKERQDAAEASFMEFAQALAKNGAFIPKFMFDQFENIRKECAFQISCFKYWPSLDNQISQEQEKERKKLTSKIYDERESLRDDLRKYLEKLDVL